MWIKTQLGELVNLERLPSISVADTKVLGVFALGHSTVLGKFDSRAEAVAYFNQLEKLLTKETDHD